MLIWQACRPRTLLRPSLLCDLCDPHPFLHKSAFFSLAKNLLGTQSFWYTSSASSAVNTRGLSAALILAGGKKKREFHNSGVAEGHKSGPGTPTWKYVNVHAKPVPKAPKGANVPRFFVSTEVVRNSCKGSVFQLSESETKHALRVLRLSEGAWLEVTDGRGLLVEAQLRGLTYSNRAFATAFSDPVQVPWVGPKWEVVVALGSLHGGRADTLVEKVTELGAYSLRPLLTHRSRTIGRYEEKTTVKVVSVEELSDMSELEEANDFVATGRFARWERIGVSASKQSLRVQGLLLRPPCILEDLLPLVESGAPTFVAAQGAPPLNDVLANSAEPLKVVGASGSQKPVLLLVGPEGDFTEDEMKTLIAAGARPVGLGSNRLRVETAAISLVNGAVLQYESMKYRTDGRLMNEQKLAA